jgi:hypothetical protein
MPKPRQALAGPKTGASKAIAGGYGGELLLQRLKLGSARKWGGRANGIRANGIREVWGRQRRSLLRCRFRHRDASSARYGLQVSMSVDPAILNSTSFWIGSNSRGCERSNVRRRRARAAALSADIEATCSGRASSLVIRCWSIRAFMTSS